MNCNPYEVSYCHKDMARPQAADGEHALQVERVDTNIMKGSRRQPTSGILLVLTVKHQDITKYYT
jgi:hypothetical protein